MVVGVFAPVVRHVGVLERVLRRVAKKEVMRRLLYRAVYEFPDYL